MSTFSYQTPVQFQWKWIFYKLTLVPQSGWPLPRVPLNQGDPSCQSPAWPRMAAGSDRFWLLELRVSRTFLDNLRPICSVHGYPARRAASPADPDNSLIPQRWIGAPDFPSEWAETGLTSLIAGSYCLLCHRTMRVAHDGESSEYLVRHSRRKRPGDSWPLPAAVCLVSLTRPGIDGGSGRISGRRIG